MGLYPHLFTICVCPVSRQVLSVVYSLVSASSLYLGMHQCLGILDTLNATNLAYNQPR